MCSPHFFVSWVDRIVENWWSLEKQFLHIFQRSERDLEIPHQNWQTDGNPACGWVQSDLTDEHLVRTDDGVVYARSVRRTRREQLVRRELEGSHRDPTEAEGR